LEKHEVDKPQLSLETRILLLAISIFLAALFVVGIVAGTTLIDPYVKQLGERAMSIARSVALIPAIIENVGTKGGEKIIQPLADEIRKKTGAEFVVVMDTRSIRYSHPVPDRIGKTFVGGDEGPALAGKEYVSNSIGTLGPSMRAFVPIYRDGKIAGAVSVGILMKDVNAMRWNLLRDMIIALALGLAVSAAGARFLAKGIKREIKGLEPWEITRVLIEREAILNSVREGIIAVDKKGCVTLLNDSAKKLLGVDEKILGRPITESLPKARMPEVLETGEPIMDQEIRVGSSRLIANIMPLREKGRVVGAISSFRDMTEFEALAEELTGVRRFVDALRVRTHEFLNKLHTVSGLIQLGEKERAVEYISGIVTAQQELMSLITRRIKNASVGGLLLGKSGRCKELGIDFSIDPDSWLGSQPAVETNTLVTIIGNLLGNAIQAVLPMPREKRSIEFSIFEESGKTLISVRDSGTGIPAKNLDRIFEKGFTTKDGSEGLGLAHVRELVDIYNGEISVESKPGKYTEFVITLPGGGAGHE
jgi:PAS domain S-box-containing protein